MEGAFDTGDKDGEEYLKTIKNKQIDAQKDLGVKMPHYVYDEQKVVSVAPENNSK